VYANPMAASFSKLNLSIPVSLFNSTAGLQPTSTSRNKIRLCIFFMDLSKKIIIYRSLLFVEVLNGTALSVFGIWDW
jgi:hypothetical protein